MLRLLFLLIDCSQRGTVIELFHTKEVESDVVAKLPEFLCGYVARVLAQEFSHGLVHCETLAADNEITLLLIYYLLLTGSARCLSIRDRL